MVKPGYGRVTTRGGHAGTQQAGARKRIGKGEAKAAVRAAQLAWVRGIMSRLNMKAHPLALMADVSSSTLSRFLEENSASTLEASTVAALVRATGMPSPDPSDAIFEIAQITGFREEAAPWSDSGTDLRAAAIKAFCGADPNKIAWTVRSGVLALKGVMPGDVLIVDMTRQPNAGDIVIAQIEEGLGAVTACRLWQPPHLIAASMDPAAYKPEYVDNVRVRTVGTMIALLRSVD